MNNQTNVDIVRRIYEAVGRGDVPAVLDLVTEDVEWSLQGPDNIPFAGTRHGKEGVGEFFTLVGTNLEFEAFGPRDIVADGDTVVAVGHERSRSRSTGRTLAQDWAHVYTLSDGKVVRFQAFEDTAALSAALGEG